MPRVIALKEHGNAYGPVWELAEDGSGLEPRAGDPYEKRPGDRYDHPSPQQLLDDRVVALPENPLDRDGDGRPGGSAPGENSSSAVGAQRRRARSGGARGPRQTDK